jgi:AcrR family transcriptional regulator
MATKPKPDVQAATKPRTPAVPKARKSSDASAASKASRTREPDAPSPWKKTRDAESERMFKRDAVLRTAAQIFNEKGFHSTSLDEVAERLEISKPTLYYYTKNKDDILFQCVSRGLEMMQGAIEKVGQSGGTARDKLIAAMHQYAEIVTMDFGMCVIRVGEDPLPPESRKKLRNMKGAIDLEFRELIRQGIEEGSITPCDPKMAAFAIAGALSWIGRWYRPDGPHTPEEISEQFIQLLSVGLFNVGTASQRKPASTTGKLVSAAKKSIVRKTPKTVATPRKTVPKK